MTGDQGIPVRGSPVSPLLFLTLLKLNRLTRLEEEAARTIYRLFESG